MPLKRVVMLLVAACFVGLLTGCGVPKDEHAAVVAELNAAYAEIETNKVSIASLESDLESAQKEVWSVGLQLKDAEKAVQEIEEKEAGTAQALVDEQAKTARLEDNLSAAQSALAAANGKIAELEAALDNLQAEYDNLTHRFKELKKNMLAMGGDVPIEVEAAKPAPAPESSAGSQSAMDLLNDMGME